MARLNGSVTAVNGHAKSGSKGHIEELDNEKAEPKRPRLSEKTDHSRWRLLDEAGRQTWHYLEDDEQIKEWPQSFADKYFLGVPTVCTGLHFFDHMLTYKEPSEASATKDSSRYGQERARVFPAFTTTPRKLGLRVWRTYVSTSWDRYRLVCHRDRNT